MTEIAYAHFGQRLNGGFYYGPRLKDPLDITGQINRLIDAALEEEITRDKPRGYLGGSRLGLECHRRLAYEYELGRQNLAAYEAGDKRANRHDFEGRIIRRFKFGHLHEDETARWMKQAGFHLATEKPDGGQFGWYVAHDPETGRPRMSGHLDGVIYDGPIQLPYPMIWEHKIMKHSIWRATLSRGVEKEHQVYYIQMQVYMAYMGYKHAMFMALDSDTSELLVEIVPFNAAAAQWGSDRGVKVLESNVPEELPRIAHDETDHRCRDCQFAARCWKRAEQKPVETPAWLG